MDNINKKYFTPDIEDIRVGYECETEIEVHDPKTTSSKMKIWKPIKIGCVEWQGLIYTAQIEPSRIRVPYLTKEQIEAEGWTYKSTTTYLGGISESFEKDNRFIVLRNHVLQVIVKDPSKEEQILGVPSEHFRFIAPCKDINTFRYICKLLGI